MATALKFLTLMNPPGKHKHMKTMRLARRSRSGRFVRPSSVRKARRVSRRVRTNPPKMTPAMRKKISLAVKRSIRARKSAPRSVARRSSRRTSMVVARRSSTISPAIRRKISLGVRRANRGGSSRGSSGGGSSIKAGKGILGMVSKDTLMIAGGAVAASFGTGIILAKFGSKLPGMTSANPKTVEYARAAYSVVIPLGAAYLLRNKQRRIAEGLVIGGLIMAFNSLIRTFAPTAATTVAQGPMGNFYETSSLRGMGLAGEVPLGLGEYVSGANPGTIASDLTAKAFPDSAW
jgi:hypothetical protein